MSSVYLFPKPARKLSWRSELESRGLKVLAAESSEQLHQLVNTQRIDAVVVEQHLGGFLTGLEILQRLREQLLRPLLVVIGDLTESEKVLAASFESTMSVPGMRDSIKSAPPFRIC